MEYRSLASLTLADARVLLGPAVARSLWGDDLEAPDLDGGKPLPDLLSTAGRAPHGPVTGEDLARLYVPLLDVNAAPDAALLRIPTLGAADITALKVARPFFSLEEIDAHGPDLAEVLRRAGAWLGHQGFGFVDRPRRREVHLRPVDEGFLLRYSAGTDPATLEAALSDGGLEATGHLVDERLLVLRWRAPAEGRVAIRRRLKRRPEVETLAPLLADEEGFVRGACPDRLDLCLSDPDPAAWDSLLHRFALAPVLVYGGGYGSVRVTGHPHDLGAPYRAMRELAAVPGVSFVEPTWIA